MQRKILIPIPLTLGAILFLAHPTYAQLIEDRMRITTEDGEKFIGRLKRYDDYSLTIFTDSTEQSIAYTDIVRLQKSFGVRSHYRDGAMVGLGVGVFGSIVGASAGGDSFVSIVGIAGLGSLTGMLVGAVIKREKWKRLNIRDQDAASIMPAIGVHPTVLAPGDRMRITTENGGTLFGRVKSFNNFSLTIIINSTEVSIAYTDMIRLQRSLGKRSHFIKGTLIGLGTGALVSIVAVASAGEIEGPGAAGAVLGIGVLTSGGTLLGALVGAATRTERWERMDIPGQSAVSVTPVIGVHPNGRLALGARVLF